MENSVIYSIDKGLFELRLVEKGATERLSNIEIDVWQVGVRNAELAIIIAIIIYH